jgi:hypothetical protein
MDWASWVGNSSIVDQLFKGLGVCTQKSNKDDIIVP